MGFVSVNKNAYRYTTGYVARWQPKTEYPPWDFYKLNERVKNLHAAALISIKKTYSLFRCYTEVSYRYEYRCFVRNWKFNATVLLYTGIQSDSHRFGGSGNFVNFFKFWCASVKYFFLHHFKPNKDRYVFHINILYLGLVCQISLVFITIISNNCGKHNY